MPTVEFNVSGAGKVVDANAKVNAAIKKGHGDLVKDLVKGNRALLSDESKSAAEKVKISKATFRLIRGSERQAAGERKRELEQSVTAQRAAARVVERVGKQNATTQETLNSKIRATTAAFKTAGGSPELLKKEIGRLKKKYGQVEKQQQTAFGAASITRLATYAAGFASVHRVVALITTEIKKQQELIDKQVATKLSVSQSRNLVLRNLSSKTPAEQQEALAASRRIAEERGISEVAINAGLAEALSASGGKIKPSIAAVQLAARNLADRPSEIGMAAGAILDISKVTDSGDPRAGFGLLTKVGELGRVVSPRLQATNIAPALIGAKSFGFSGREGGALFAALSSAGGDVTGERTGTALVQIGKKLAKFDAGDATFAGLTGGEKIAFLQANPKLARKFLSDFGGEAKVLGPIQDLLLRPGSVAAKELANNLRLIPDNAGLIKFTEKALSVFKQNKLEPVAQRVRALKSVAETLRLREPATSVSQEERDVFREILMRTGSSALGASVEDFLRGAQDSGKGLTVKSLRFALEERVSKIQTPSFLGFEVPPLPGEPGRVLNEQETEQLRVLRILVEFLKNNSGDQKNTGRKIDRTNELLEQALDNGGLVGVAG